jgi:AraC-like DNA-binding protein
MTVFIDTASVRPSERFDYWAELSPRVFMPVGVELPAGAQRRDDRSFSGLVMGHDVGPLRVCRIVADASEILRTPQNIRSSDPETLDVALQVRGTTTIEQDGRLARLRPGDLCGYQSSRPFLIRPDGPVEFVLLTLAREALGSREQAICTLTARRMAGDTGLASLIGPFLVRLADGLDAGRVRPEHAAVPDGVLDLVQGLFAEHMGSEDLASGGVLLAGIKAYIDEHLGSPDLGPEEIARANHISTRYLHRLFEGEGLSVSEWIRDQRVERCRRDLRDPLLQHESILSIATRWGLPNSAHFSRVYRGAFGRSPREERRLALAARAAS